MSLYPSLWILFNGLSELEGERSLRFMLHQQISQNPSSKIYNKITQTLFSIPKIGEVVSLISFPASKWLSSYKANIPQDVFMTRLEFNRLLNGCKITEVYD